MIIDPIPKYISIDEWRVNFSSPPPCRSTVLAWIHGNKITPAAVKIGGKWYLPRESKHINESPPAI